jgi:acyl carrier protein
LERPKRSEGATGNTPGVSKRGAYRRASSGEYLALQHIFSHLQQFHFGIQYEAAPSVSSERSFGPTRKGDPKGSTQMQVDAARALIADHFAVALDAVRDEASFTSDLGADSLDMIELAMRFEEELDIAIDDNESEACDTVEDALNLLQSKILERKAA